MTRAQLTTIATTIAETREEFSASTVELTIAAAALDTLAVLLCLRLLGNDENPPITRTEFLTLAGCANPN